MSPNDWRRQLEDMLRIEAPDAVLERSTNGYRIRMPSGAVVFTSYTPSDVRALKNVRGNVRRALKEQSRGT